MKTVKLTKLEKKVRGLASRQARRRLTRVRWDRFHKSYENYIRWQAFALWVRAVVDSEGRIPHWLEKVLRKRCPGFPEQRAHARKKRPLDLQLREWIDDQVFRFAKEEGWLDALAFYGFRDARFEGIWAYWEHCESEWKKRRPKSFPTFLEWWHAALNCKLQGEVSCAVVAKAVEKYIDCQGFVYWLRPLFRMSMTQLPAHVALELGQECPGLLEFVKTHTSAAYGVKPKSWQALLSWCKDHVLSQAKKEGWLDGVLIQARVHPRRVRMADYALLWRRSRLENPPSTYPSFGQWKRDAESHVRIGRK